MSARNDGSEEAAVKGPGWSRNATTTAYICLGSIEDGGRKRKEGGGRGTRCVLSWGMLEDGRREHCQRVLRRRERFATSSFRARGIDARSRLFLALFSFVRGFNRPTAHALRVVLITTSTSQIQSNIATGRLAAKACPETSLQSTCTLETFSGGFDEGLEARRWWLRGAPRSNVLVSCLVWGLKLEGRCEPFSRSTLHCSLCHGPLGCFTCKGKNSRTFVTNLPNSASFGFAYKA